MKLTNLNTCKDSLVSSTKSVDQTEAELNQKIIERDQLLYADGTGLYTIAQNVKKYVTNVVLLGLAKDRFESELRKNGYENITIADSFADGVDKAFEKTDDVILLSPACSSYDMFSGYEERGRVFKEYAISKK